MRDNLKNKNMFKQIAGKTSYIRHIHILLFRTVFWN